MLQLESVAITLGSNCFGPFSFAIKAGERVAILGPSGAGKSTLLKIMSREWPVSKGQILLDGKPLSDWRLSELSYRRAVLPQSTDVAFGLMTDLVIALGRVARDPDQKINEIVKSSAELAHANHLLGRRLDLLSGGEQARVQLARVFAQLWDVENGLILVDEPLAALDPGLQIDLLDSLDTFAFQRGHALVAILHDINLAIAGFDRLLLVKDGKLFGDLPTNMQAVPALESLYGIALSCVADREGSLVVTPVRRATRRPVMAKEIAKEIAKVVA